MQKSNKVLEYITNNDCPIVFDLDGTLSSYNYGEYQANSDLDGVDDKLFFDEHIYLTVAKPIPVIQEFLKKKNMDNIYLLSMEHGNKEEEKIEFVVGNYRFKRENCHFTKTFEEKIDILNKLEKEFRSNLTPVFIDDYAELLREVRDKTNYYTAHVTLFFENIK